MKEKILNPTAVHFIQRLLFLSILLITMFLGGCGSKPEKPTAEEISLIETIYAFQMLKSDLESGNRWKKINKDSIALIRFKFNRGLSRAKFQLVTYFTVRRKFGEKEIPMELSQTGNGVSLPTQNVIIGNLDLNWNNIVEKIMLPDSTIDPLFHHVLLEPAIKQSNLYFIASLKKADGSMYKDISILVPSNVNGTQPDWNLADANPSPPAIHN